MFDVYFGKISFNTLGTKTKITNAYLDLQINSNYPNVEI